MFTAYIIHDMGHPQLMASLERKLQQLLDSRQVKGTAHWYYDEDAEDGTEYGVRIDVQETLSSRSQLLKFISDYCTDLYGDVIRVEVA